MFQNIKPNSKITLYEKARILEKDYFVRSSEPVKTDNGGIYLLAASNYNTQNKSNADYIYPFQRVN